jgi:hypothetical protein
MKKASLALLLLSLFWVACATVPKTPVSLTSLNPGELQGTWEGQRVMHFDRNVYQDIAVLEMETGAPPFRGKLTVYPSGRPTSGNPPQTYSFDRGEISGEGKLFLPMEKDISVILRLYRDEKGQLLDGDFNYRTNRGTISLRKK